MKKLFWLLYGKSVKMIFFNEIRLKRKYGYCFTDEQIKSLSKVLSIIADSEISKKVEAV